MLAYSINLDSVSVVTKGGDLLTYCRDTDKGKKIVEFIKNNDENGLVDYLESFKRTVETAYGSSASFRVENDIVFIPNKKTGKEDALPVTIGNRVLEFAKEGLPCQPIINFWHRLNNNTSNDAVNRLFCCLEANHHPLLPDGRVLFWKRVNNLADGKLVDFFTGTFDNSVGQTPKMQRNKVNEDHNVTCAEGLHVASWDYARNTYRAGEGVLVEVAVDPADVVSVPTDYNEQKARVCEYEVLRVVEEEDKSLLSKYDDECDDCGCRDEDEDDC